jgi:hypothetical protein
VKGAATGAAGCWEGNLKLKGAAAGCCEGNWNLKGATTPWWGWVEGRAKLNWDGLEVALTLFAERDGTKLAKAVPAGLTFSPRSYWTWREENMF